LICTRCHKSVPDGQLACDCFVLHAQTEKAELAVKRFKAIEALLFLRDGHIFPDRKHATSICGTATIKTYNDKKTSNLTPSVVDTEKISCGKCKELIGHA
jgi:hypothetical protein